MSNIAFCMQKRIVITLFILCCIVKSVYGTSPTPLDTILYRTMRAAELHNRLVESFEAELYTRSYVETIRRNFLSHFTNLIPRFSLQDPHYGEAFIETLGTLRFEYPNSYALNISLVNGTLTRTEDIESIPFNLFHFNIYSETSNEERFIMPTRFNTARNYTFELDHTFVEDDIVYYVINFSPVFTNSRLLTGQFIVESDSWRITFFRGEGLDIFSTFWFEVTMGTGLVVSFLPVSVVINQTQSYFGNETQTIHVAHLTYTDILLRHVIDSNRSLNISDFYQIRLDSVSVYSNPDFWNERRPISLSERGTGILDRFHEREHEELYQASNLSQKPGMGLFAQRMLMSAHFTHRSTTVRYSGLLNPLMLSYSTYDGFVYRQRLRLDFRLPHERTINVNAHVGYMFNRRELFSDITTRWNYNPEEMGSLTLSVGNRTPSYSSSFIEQVQENLRQYGLTFEDVSLPYFRNYYLRLYNTFEATNGFLINTGVEYHIRTSIKNPNVVVPFQTNSQASANNINDLFGTRRAFVPFLHLSWTPKQFYRLEGRQKIPVRSHFPTFELELARSFQHILWSTSEYNRVEVNINHHIPLVMLRSLSYQVGAGVFTNQRTEYFADFVFFTRSNFPRSWNDGLGGIFHLLNRTLYHASDSYIQAHVMYETPFFILSRIPFVSNFAAKERLYLSQLYTPQIVSYTEFGYGLGNRFFNTALFVAFHQTKFHGIGARFVLEF